MTDTRCRACVWQPDKQYVDGCDEQDGDASGQTFGTLMMTQIVKPQRLSQPVAPGALLKRAVNLRNIMRMRLIEPERDEAYLELVRQLPCLHCGMEPCEAAHVRMASAAHGKASGLGKTPPDRWALPLCSEHHRNARDAQHKRGEREFWDSLGIPALTVCERLYAVRGDLVAMRAVVIRAISERAR